MKLKDVSFPSIAIAALLLLSGFALRAQDIMGGAGSTEDIVGGAGTGSVFTSRVVKKRHDRPKEKPAAAPRSTASAAPLKRKVIARTTPKVDPATRKPTPAELAENFMEQGDAFYN
ncbi:MAG: hypothetical protein JOZ52_05580, partial [Acidobacteria bacterium]|nr:hypothetical protein [Acidobacteriota bacterium]